MYVFYFILIKDILQDILYSMTPIQKKVIDVFRTHPELLKPSEDHSLHAKRKD